MSYDTSVYGEIAINPPLPYSAIRGSAHRPAPMGSANTTLTFIEMAVMTETATGIDCHSTAIGITTRYAESGPHYGIKEELQTIIDGQPEHYDYIGELVAFGTDPGDIVRYRVDGRRVVEEKAEIRWPDGSVFKASEF